MLPGAKPGPTGLPVSQFHDLPAGLRCRAPFYLSAGAAVVAAAVTAFALPETARGRAMAETQLSPQHQQQYSGPNRPYWQQAEERPEGRKDSGSRLLPLLRRDTGDSQAAVPSSDGSSSSLAGDGSGQNQAAAATPAATAPQHLSAPPAQGWDGTDDSPAGVQHMRRQGRQWLPRVPAGWLAILGSVDFCAIALVSTPPASNSSPGLN